MSVDGSTGFQRTPGRKAGGFSFPAGYTLLELVIVITVFGVIIAGVASCLVPAHLASVRCSNERSAMSSLCAIRTAQGDFKTNDRDGNGIADFWTADVYALYGLIPARSPSALPADTAHAGNAIKLIDASLAGSDGLTRQGLYGNVEFSSAPGRAGTRHGYIFRSLHHQQRWGQQSASLLNDTDGPGRFYGGCHDLERFGCIAFPESLESGKLIFLMSEGNEVWKYNLPGVYVAAFTGATGASTDSHSATSGPDLAPEFTLEATSGQGTFPAAPAAVGCSRPE